MPEAEIHRDPVPVSKGSETVLVVDDIESVRTFLCEALRMFGYSVICAEDGRDGLRKFIENKDKIHVMLLDIVMPELSGIELFNKIVKLGSNAKVLFMSGYNDVVDKTNLRDEIKCLSKPFEIKTLLKEIREVLDN